MHSYIPSMSPQAALNAQPAASDPTTERLSCLCTRVHASLVRTDPQPSLGMCVRVWCTSASCLSCMPPLHAAFTCARCASYSVFLQSCPAGPSSMAGIEERRPRYSRFLQSLDARMRRTHIPEGGARLRRGVVLHTVSRGNIL